MYCKGTGRIHLEDIDFELNGKQYTVLNVSIEYEVEFFARRYNHNCCVDYDSEDVFECNCTDWSIEDSKVYDTEGRLVEDLDNNEFVNILNSKKNIAEICVNDFAEHGRY